VNDEQDLMIINKSGIAIRLKLSEVRVMGRDTQGVKLINLGKRNDVISSVCQVNAEEEEEELVEGAVNVDNEGVETDNETTEVETQE
jgi:DNA gyrase subunit A